MEDIEKVRRLDQALKTFSPSLGYTEIRKRGKLLKYIVHTHVLGDRDILVPGREAKAEKELLSELENLLTYCKLPSPFPAPKEPPLWLVPEARAFCLSPRLGLHRFGRQIVIQERATGAKPNEYVTKAQIIHVAPVGGGGWLLDIFRYFPTDRSSYKDQLHYTAAMGWNASMYHYIEKKGLPPSVARDTLAGNQRELINEIIRALAEPGWDAAANKGRDILEEVLTLWRR